MAIQSFADIFELPTRQKALFLAVVLALIALLYWYFFFSGVTARIQDLRNEIEGANGLKFQVAQQQEIADNLDKFTAEVERLEIELKKALAELPDKKEIDQLLRHISDVGRDSGLEIRLFKPRPEEKKDYYAEVPVEVEVFGSFHQVATFFDEVGDLSRIVNLDEFNMSTPEVLEDRVNLKTAVIATTFRFLDEAERIKVDNKKTERRRR